MEANTVSKKVQTTQGGKLVKHHQQLMTMAFADLPFQTIGQTTADLVEDEANQRLGPGDIGKRNDQVEGDRVLGVHQVGDALIASHGRRGHDWVIGHGRRKDA